MAEGWANYLARGVPPVRRALIGGNWKCNGVTATVYTSLSFISIPYNNNYHSYV